MRRPVYVVDAKNPGSDVAAEVAAALAAASILYRDHPRYEQLSKTCLEHAIQLWNFATSFR